MYLDSDAPIGYLLSIGGACSLLLLALLQLGARLTWQAKVVRSFSFAANRPEIYLGVFLLVSMVYLSKPLISQHFAVLHQVLLAIALLPIALFWLFCHALCREQQPFPTWGWVVIAANVVCHSAALNLAESPPHYAGFASTALAAAYVAKLVMLLSSVLVLLQDYRQDLDEARRQLRRALLCLLGVAMLAVTLGQLVFHASQAALSPAALNAYGIAIWVLALLCSVWLLGLAPRVLLPSLSDANAQGANGKNGNQMSAAEQALAAALTSAMQNGVYRQPGLAITQLAQNMAVPEHQLRRLINQRLGFRNFNEYINSQRIDEAARYLVDPAQPFATVLEIALHVGFGSLSPFNLAFRQRHNLTPTQYRAKHLPAQV